MKSLMTIFLFLGLALTAQNLILKEETAFKIVRLPGRVEAQRDTQIVTNRMAEVVGLPVKQGAVVKAGTILVQLEDKALQQQLKAAREAESAQVAVVEQAKLQAARMERLLVKGAISKLRAEAAELELRGSRAKLEEVRGQVRQLQESGAYLEIRAKSEGQLAELMVALGDIAMPGQPLGRFTGRAGRALAVSLPDFLKGSLEKARWRVRVPGDEWLESRLETQVGLADSHTSSRTLYLELPSGLEPNQRLDVEMLLEVEGLFLPKSAVERRGNMTFVRVLEDGKAMRRLVKLGAELPDGRLTLISGLEAGATLVVGGAGHE